MALLTISALSLYEILVGADGEALHCHESATGPLLLATPEEWTKNEVARSVPCTSKMHTCDGNGEGDIVSFRERTMAGSRPAGRGLAGRDETAAAQPPDLYQITTPDSLSTRTQNASCLGAGLGMDPTRH